MPTPCDPRRLWERMAAVAADTGEPVMPSEAAMAATLSGRSGRILAFREISEMMGRRA